MTSEEMRQKLWMHIKKVHKTSKNAAKHWGVSGGFVSMVLNGKKHPTETILNDLGLIEIIEYRKPLTPFQPERRRMAARPVESIVIRGGNNETE